MEILINIVCNIIASLAFLFIVLYTLRPKVEISEYICKQINDYETSPQFIYVFKIINKSRFSAFDIQLELFKLEQYRVTAKGINNRINLVPLVVNHIKHIPPFASTAHCHKSSFASHALVFRTNVTLEHILNKERETLQLQVTLRHGLTGLSRVYQKDYIKINAIKTGQFKFGNSLEIE